MIHWSVPKTYFLGVLLLLLPIPLVSIDVSLDVVINNGSTQTLRANLGDDFAFAASAFVETNNIYNGAGCTADAECVAKQLLEALERQAVAQAAAASAGDGASAASHAVQESAAGPAAVETLAPGLPLWSNAGWHENGHPFAAHTPGAAATSRSEARLQPLRAHFATMTANASLALAQLRVTAQQRTNAAQPATHQPNTSPLPSEQTPPSVPCSGSIYEAGFSALEIPLPGGGAPRRALRGCSGPVQQSKVVLAIGVISAPKNLQVLRYSFNPLSSLNANTIVCQC